MICVLHSKFGLPFEAHKEQEKESFYLICFFVECDKHMISPSKLPLFLTGTFYSQFYQV